MPTLNTSIEVPHSEQFQRLDQSLINATARVLFFGC